MINCIIIKKSGMVCINLPCLKKYHQEQAFQQIHIMPQPVSLKTVSQGNIPARILQS